MTRSATLRSFAKINLDLRVLHKGADGFHELRTVFQTISLADTIVIEYQKARRTELTLDDPAAIPDNLILRAARSVLHSMRTAATVRFRLVKKIPMGGGLGGGSSNAAAVLLALPALAGRTLPFEKLAGLAAELGSDVPFFLLGGTALGSGRGTELYPLEEIAPQPILVISPGLHIATGPAYAALNRELTFPGSSRSINNFQAFVRALAETRSAGAAGSFSANDFEAAVSSQYPQLKTIQGKLWKYGAAAVRMTGSGSAVFGIFSSREDRERARIELQGDRVFHGYRVYPAALVSRTGYRGLWQRQLAGHLHPDRKLWPPHSVYET
jgi:4-diphosphocytidyl-2-C-methyl-D-erythritol kinase